MFLLMGNGCLMPIDALILYTGADALPPITKAIIEALDFMGTSYDSNSAVVSELESMDSR